MKTLPLSWTTVAVDTTSEVFFPCTGWMDSADIAKLRGSFELRGVTGNMAAAPGYQTANVENSPDIANALGSFPNTNNVYYGGSFTDVSSNTSAKRLVRFGFVVKLTSGSTLAIARVAGAIDIVKASA